MRKRKQKSISGYVVPQVAEMVLRQSTRRIAFIALFSTIGVLIWGMVGAWLISLSDEHIWLSSYVEIAFAVNIAMVFPNVKEASLKVKHAILIARFKRMMSLGYKERSYEDASSILETLSKYWIAVFDGRAQRELHFCIMLGKWFAGGSLIILLTDCTGWAIFLLPLLIAPAIAFKIGVLVEFSQVVSDMFDEIKLMAVSKKLKVDNPLGGVNLC